MKILEKYYRSQKEHLRKEYKNAFYKTWRSEDTLDWWRHERMYKCLNPLIKTSESWLTIGDGKYARDARYLIKRKAKATASDIETKYLIKAKAENKIHQYKKINAEEIKLPENSYDYVLCKESFHHFPRPHVALYEMLRVARKGVVLIEPQDAVSMVSRRYKDSFEPSGNYVYQVSFRELMKTSIGIGLPAIASKEIDDVYVNGVEKIKFKSFSKEKIYIFLTLLVLNLAYQIRLRKRNMIVVSIFKQKPDSGTVKKLLKDKHLYQKLPKNPYIK